ncbi:rhodanese-like domain-containing protein [Halocalculus aciditolerans]|uniref:Rhodanese-like domain-containing protein n=1 Tax=Halocalculus aciditolerans TaxID=1383812 RepID=A0A830FLZ3_9EURY|nr:rhodanese-like domain-containing protein [Halocalculus aciditolerans]GGL68873.1 rhodanese-like domain-containing protein [Halocalculus aciditolerans]
MDGEITPEEVNALTVGEDVRVVDIRMPGAYQRGHIPGSENIPFQQLPQRVGDLDGASHVVTVCPHGKSSVQAANLVASYDGLDDDARVQSMQGGLSAWEYDLETPEQRDEGPSAPESPF